MLSTDARRGVGGGLEEGGQALFCLRSEEALFLEVKDLVFRSAKLTRQVRILLRVCQNFNRGWEFMLGLGYG